MLKGGYLGDSNSIWLVKWRLRHTERDTRDVPAQRKGHVRTQWEGREASREARGETNPAGTLVWTSSPKNYEKRNVCCLSHPVCDTLFWQPEATNTSVLMWKWNFRLSFQNILTTKYYWNYKMITPGKGWQ